MNRYMLIVLIGTAVVLIGLLMLGSNQVKHILREWDSEENRAEQDYKTLKTLKLDIESRAREVQGFYAIPVFIWAAFASCINIHLFRYKAPTAPLRLLTTATAALSLALALLALVQIIAGFQRGETTNGVCILGAIFVVITAVLTCGSVFFCNKQDSRPNMERDAT